MMGLKVPRICNCYVINVNVGVFRLLIAPAFDGMRIRLSFKVFSVHLFTSHPFGRLLHLLTAEESVNSSPKLTVP